MDKWEWRKEEDGGEYQGGEGVIYCTDCTVMWACKSFCVSISVAIVVPYSIAFLEQDKRQTKMSISFLFNSFWLKVQIVVTETDTETYARF